MMFLTHASVGLFIGLLILKLASLPVNETVFLVLLVLGSIFPDIDNTKSVLGRRIKPLSMLFKHRGFFHSILPAVIIGIIIFLITSNSYYTAAYIVGFLSHLLIDSLTPGGINFFWPSKLKLKGKLVTGSVFDWALLVIFIILDFLLIVNVV